MSTTLSLIGLPRAAGAFADKAIDGLPNFGVLVDEYDTWRRLPFDPPGVVSIFEAGTTTRADLFSDITLTTPISNPVTLATTVVGGITYQKFPLSVYTHVAYTTQLNDSSQTGVRRPGIQDLNGRDASLATAATTSGAYDRTLRDWLDDTVVAAGFGSMSLTSSSTTTATLEAAIGEVAARGGGVVQIGPGDFPILTLTLPAGVVLQGSGRGVTILRSLEGEAVITLGGDRAGLRDITLDGSNLVPQSIGLAGMGIDESVLDRVDIANFNTGIRFVGGRHNRWTDVDVSTCARNVELRGDLDASDTNDGDELRENSWTGGHIRLATSFGLRLSFEDAIVEGFLMEGVRFEECSGNAVELNGARQLKFINCVWIDNIVNIFAEDDSDTSEEENNTIIGLLVDGGSMTGGEVELKGTLQDARFRGVNLSNVDFILTLPANPLLLIDCREDGNVTIAGDTEKLVRSTDGMFQEVTAITTDATVTSIWAIQLEPGEVVLCEAKAIAKQRNGVGIGKYHIEVGAERPGSVLTFDNQTSNFTLGLTLTGATSEATALIVNQTDSGATGNLTLRNIVGTFQNNEDIADSATGNGRVVGSITAVNVTVDATGVSVLRTETESASLNGTCTFVASVDELQLRVTGEANKSIDWTVDIMVTRP